MADFFISFNKNDRKWAAWIAWTLHDEGYTVIFQDWDFRPGNHFVVKMHEALASSDRLIAVLSQTYLASAYTLPEWAAVFADDSTGEEAKVVPVKVGACEPPGLLKGIIRIDLIGKKEAEAKAELLAGLLPSGRPEVSPPFPGSDPEFPSEPDRLPQPQPQPQPAQSMPAPSAPPQAGTPQPNATLPARPWFFPGSWMTPLRWAIAGAMIAILLGAGLWYALLPPESPEKLRARYEAQTSRARELVVKDDLVLKDKEAEELEKLIPSLHELQQDLDVRSNWVETYGIVCRHRPHLLQNIPPPPGVRPCQ